MNKSTKLLAGALVLGGIVSFTSPASADWFPRRGEIRNDRSELYKDRQELRRDLRRGAGRDEIARDRREIFQDRRELARDGGRYGYNNREWNHRWYRH
jgi:hypothetical protein